MPGSIWCQFNVTFAAQPTNQPRGEGSLLSGTYRHVSNALMRKFHFCFAYLAIGISKKSKSESNFLASPFGSRPVASCWWWWCAVYYLWVRLFAPKSVSSRTINFRNRPNSCMQMLPGGRQRAKSIPNIVISNTLLYNPQMPSALSNYLAFSLNTIYMRYAARQIYMLLLCICKLFFGGDESFCFWIGHWRDCTGCPDEAHE